MSDKKRLFVTGIGTGIGKTIVSAVLVEKLKADYWKPVQSGDLADSDSIKVKQLISNKQSHFFPDTYQLTQPFSPHKSAALDGITIEATKFVLPNTENDLIIEGAGGLMVPLNNDFLIIDLIKQLNAEVVLVSRNYLGSINHTLLSVFALKQRQIPIRGIIFNGNNDAYSEVYILKSTNIELLGRLPEFDKPDPGNIIEAGKYISL